jgi:hypothetical protein
MFGVRCWSAYRRRCGCVEGILTHGIQGVYVDCQDVQVIAVVQDRVALITHLD